MSRARNAIAKPRQAPGESYNRCRKCERDGRTLDVNGCCTMRLTCAASVRNANQICECWHPLKRHREMDDGYCYAPDCECTKFRARVLLSKP